jgi:hypothetical protein
MNLSKLLGKRLRDDEVLDVFEACQIQDVIYDFDRWHENLPDKYWAQAKAFGFQLGFNHVQVLNVVFCYIIPEEGFSAVDPGIVGVPIHDTFDDAERACKLNRSRYSISPAKQLKLWLRVEEAGAWAHYQFVDGHVIRVTLSLPA